MPCGGVLPHEADGRRQLPQGQAVRCIVPHGVAQHCGVVARRRKLQGHGVALAGAHMAVAAARHHQHQRPPQRVRHRRGRGAQIYVQLSPAGERVSLKLHLGHPFRFGFRIIIISLRGNVKEIKTFLNFL